MLKKTIGSAEYINFLDFNLYNVPAKVDTGADSSSVWASGIVETNDGLQFVVFGKESKLYTGHKIQLAKNQYTQVTIINSFGHKEVRYKIKTKIQLAGRIIRASFTLSDRSTMKYPCLIGKKTINNKFIVDVSHGNSLKGEG
jgi:hypothetical protein